MLFVNSIRIRIFVKIVDSGNSLKVQWFVPVALTALAVGSVPGWGTKILASCKAQPRGEQNKTKQNKTKQNKTKQIQC